MLNRLLSRLYAEEDGSIQRRAGEVILGRYILGHCLRSEFTASLYRKHLGFQLEDVPRKEN